MSERKLAIIGWVAIIMATIAGIALTLIVASLPMPTLAKVGATILVWLAIGSFFFVGAVASKM